MIGPQQAWDARASPAPAGGSASSAGPQAGVGGVWQIRVERPNGAGCLDALLLKLICEIYLGCLKLSSVLI